MPDSLELLKTDATETLARGMNCDRLVLRAIGLGFDTRARIKEAIGFDYAAIEKALEREAGAIRKSTRGPIERLTLASENGNGAGKADIPFNSHIPRVRIPKEPKEYPPPVNRKTIDPVALEDAMATEGTVEAACRKIGISTPTLYLHRKNDPALTAAMERGRARYSINDTDDEKESVSPVGYIEEKPETAAELRERIAAGVDEPTAPPQSDKVVSIGGVMAVIGTTKPEPESLLEILNKLPSAIVKELRDDDAFFANAYDTLIGILDDGMDGDEKSAIWTLILYLKSLEKERYGETNSR